MWNQLCLFFLVIVAIYFFKDIITLLSILLVLTCGLLYFYNYYKK